MIFQHTHRQVLNKSKTQTRRLVKPGENLYYAENEIWNAVTTGKTNASGDPRIKWQIGQDYAVQPGRGQKAVGRIRITNIQQECLQDMSLEDVGREGIPAYTVARGVLAYYPSDPRWKYIELWDSINTKPGTQWADNPLVWVLSFELVEAADDIP